MSEVYLNSVQSALGGEAVLREVLRPKAAISIDTDLVVAADRAGHSFEHDSSAVIDQTWSFPEGVTIVAFPLVLGGIVFTVASVFRPQASPRRDDCKHPCDSGTAPEARIAQNDG